MGARSRSRLLAVAVVWIVLILIAAVVYRVVLGPVRAEQAELEQARESYRDLARQAEARGIAAPALADDDGLEMVEARTAELKELMTAGGAVGGVPLEQTVALALDSFSGYCIFRSDEFRRELAARGVGLRVADDGADYGRRFDALEQGTTPLAVFTIDALLSVAAERGRLPGTIVMMIDETVGADAMVAWSAAVPDIDALDRADARIVVTPDSPSETLARVVMANFSLDRLAEDPFATENGAAEVYDRFVRANRGDARAYVLWEPYVSKALEEPGAHVLLDSSRFRGYIVDVLVAERDYLIANEDRVRDVVESYFRTLYAIGRDAEAMATLVRDDARRGGESITEAQARRLVDGIWWKNTQENYAHFGVPGCASGDLARMEPMIESIAAVLARTGGIDRDPTDGSPGRLYYDGILRALSDASFHPGIGGTGQDETIRAGETLEPLADEQWAALTPVGTLSVDRIVFARGTARLTRRSERVLQDLAQTLASFPHYYLKVEGHARREGDADANRRLARDRAEAVSERLLSLGVEPARLRATSVEPRATDGREQSVSFVLCQRPY